MIFLFIGRILDSRYFRRFRYFKYRQTTKYRLKFPLKSLWSFALVTLFLGSVTLVTLVPSAALEITKAILPALNETTKEVETRLGVPQLKKPDYWRYNKRDDKDKNDEYEITIYWKQDKVSSSAIHFITSPPNLTSFIPDTALLVEFTPETAKNTLGTHTDNSTIWTKYLKDPKTGESWESHDGVHLLGIYRTNTKAESTAQKLRLRNDILKELFPINKPGRSERKVSP